MASAENQKTSIAPSNPATEFSYNQDVVGIPEFAGPKVGARSSLVSMEVEIKPDSAGVLYALGAFSGGLLYDGAGWWSAFAFGALLLLGSTVVAVAVTGALPHRGGARARYRREGAATC